MGGGGRGGSPVAELAGGGCAKGAGEGESNEGGSCSGIDVEGQDEGCMICRGQV